MPRPQKCRIVCTMPKCMGFKPIDGTKTRTDAAVNMSVDEYEVIRLIDLERLTQVQCAAQMDVARTTVTGIYDSARRKIADTIVNQKRLIIAGGNYRLCEGRSRGHGCQRHKCCRDD